jgi:hypothetical protein
LAWASLTAGHIADGRGRAARFVNLTAWSPGLTRESPLQRYPYDRVAGMMNLFISSWRQLDGSTITYCVRSKRPPEESHQRGRLQFTVSPALAPTSGGVRHKPPGRLFGSAVGPGKMHGHRCTWELLSSVPPVTRPCQALPMDGIEQGKIFFTPDTQGECVKATARSRRGTSARSTDDDKQKSHCSRKPSTGTGRRSSCVRDTTTDTQ